MAKSPMKLTKAGTRDTCLDGLVHLRCFECAMELEGFENYFNATIVAGKVSQAIWLKLPIGHLETYAAEKWELVDPVVPFMARATRRTRFSARGRLRPWGFLSV